VHRDDRNHRMEMFFCSITLGVNEKGKMEVRENIVVMMWNAENLDESINSVGGYETCTERIYKI